MYEQLVIDQAGRSGGVTEERKKERQKRKRKKKERKIKHYFIFFASYSDRVLFVDLLKCNIVKNCQTCT